MTVRSKKALNAARNHDCTLRLPGYCNHQSETTVACHIGTDRGWAYKCGDNMVVFACSSCHDVIDGRVKSEYSPGDLAIELLRALEETQTTLFDQGIFHV